MDDLRKKVIGSLSRVQLYEVSEAGELAIEVEADKIIARIASYAEKEQMLRLNDISRAVGLLDGLGHPDAYLEERRAELLKDLGGENE